MELNSWKSIRLGLVAGLVAAGLVGMTSLTASGTGSPSMVSYGKLTLTLTDRAGTLTLNRASEFGGGVFTQPLGVTSPCSTLVTGPVVPSGTGNLLNFSAAVAGGFSPNVQLPSNGIGVTDGANCGVPSGLVGPGETLTLDLGSYLPTDVIVSTATLQIGKSSGSDGNLRVAFDGSTSFSNPPITVGVGVKPITVVDVDGRFRSISIQSTASQSSRGLSLRSSTEFTLMAPAQATAPGAPTDVTAVAGVRQATVTWGDAPTGGSPILRYELRYSSDAGDNWTEPQTAVSGVEVTGLTDGTDYIFEVRAVNAVDDGPWATSNTVTTPTAPGAPTDVTAVAGVRQATVTWGDAPTGGSPILRYELRYSSDGGDNWTEPQTAVSGVEVTGLADGTDYIFEVRAVNAVGDGPWAASNTASTPDAPGAPTVTAVAGAKQATVEWTAGDDGGLPVSFRLRYFDTSDPDTLVPVAVVPADALSQVVTGLTDGAEYAFEVQAFNDAGESAWAQSDPVTIFTLPVDCGADVSVEGEEGDIADLVVFFRGENEDKPGDNVASECSEVGATVRIVSDDTMQPEGFEDYVFWDNTFEDVNGEIQRVNATVTIVWAPVPVADAGTLVRLIDYDGVTGPGPYRETLWCESFEETIDTSVTPSTVTYDAVLPDWTYDPETGTDGAIVVGGELKAPWCLVSDSRVQQGGVIFQTEKLFGSGDPTRLGAR